MQSKSKSQADLEILLFESPENWAAWLEQNHSTSTGLRLRFAKKAAKLHSISYAEALELALCYGWIDGQKKSYDEVSFLQKFTPRRPRSMWSKRNIEHITRLTEQGLMTPAGLSQVEQAQQDGRWEAAYDTPSNMAVPDEFLTELKQHPVAETFFATLNKTNKYAIAWRLQTAKTESTRQRRQAKIIALLNAEQKLQ